MIRLDQALVERGLCESREKAKRAILAGKVRINAQPARKASDSVKPGDALTLDAPEKFVSRGGHKLEHALLHFKLDVTGLTALDLGASTGGFTDCLLQHGAARVFAVDVGQGQLAWKLRGDPRVVVMEKTNARYLKPENFSTCEAETPSPLGGERAGVRGEETILPARKNEDPPEKLHPSPLIPLPSEGRGKQPPADVIVIDCSFISLKKILPTAIALLKTDGKIVALVKPQFEAGKTEVDKGRGVITDPAIHERVLQELEAFVSGLGGAGSPLPAVGAHGVTRPTSLIWRGVVESPLIGPAGNKEFLVLIEKTS